ncbi:helix-turn-helix transcriptional regulator [Brevundimonas sp. GCM10030266]|uniref:helix-turn-helix transcriptional regulator n=1 Tax=Brevundimonas sp. GCM10030266 TaxID=3273386 RepID=UPI0036076D2B
MAHEDGLERFLGWRQIRDLTGLGRTTAWRMRQAGDFPEPVSISPGRVAWRERDIVAWNESRGAPLHSRPPRPPRAPARRPEDRSVPERVEPRPAIEDMSITEPRARTSGRKRKTIPVAEGQLGFDF